MKHALVPTVLVATLLCGPAVAAEPALGTALGTTLAEIETALAADGYDMTKFERENGRIEVYAVREDQRLEMYLDRDSGEIIALETRQRRGPATRPGVDDREIRDTLAADGYAITSYRRERGELEVYAMRDGRLWEIKIDPRTGDVLSVEEDD